MRSIFLVLMCLFGLSLFAAQSSMIERYKPKNYSITCVQAYLNKEPINTGTFLAKNSKGIITISKGQNKNVLFNITLKSNIGKKDEPPIYLRFIKQKQLNISDILEYATEGDEILIEEFVPSINKIDLNCTPASITVVENL